MIPTETDIDQLIASCGKKTAAFLQLLKETGMRACEAEALRWADIDVERQVVYVRGKKRSDPRVLPMSNKLTAMFSRLPKTREKVFSNLAAIRTTFYASRKHAAEKLNNPRLMQIHFHTFRHWKATTLYHQTKDILYVKRFLGHRCIKNTEIYINLEQALFRTEDAEYISNATMSIKGARVLIEAGFGYVTEMNGVKLFRKRK